MNLDKYRAHISKVLKIAVKLLGTCRDAGRFGDRNGAAAEMLLGLLDSESRSELSGAKSEF